MSRRNGDFADQVLNDASGCALGGLSALVLGGVYLVVNAFKKKPEAELRKLDSSSHWGSKTIEVTCPACGAANESGAKRCRACGKNLNPPPASWTDQAVKPAGMDPTLLWVGIIGFLIIVAFCIVVASS
jgi:hypothetical protein